MQIYGRIHRVGQLHLPRYTLLYGDVPAERRPAMALRRKMQSLNAQTTGLGSGAMDVTEQDVPGLLSERGNRAAERWASGNHGLNKHLANPVKSGSTGNREGERAPAHRPDPAARLA